MSIVLLADVVIRSRKGQHPFRAQIHKAVQCPDLHLEPFDFYEKHGGSVPEFPHYEIELVEPRGEFFQQHALHIHRSRCADAPFVCYPLRIATIDDALRVFRTWCLGSVSAIAEQVDLNTIFAEAGNNSERMAQLLCERYEIYEEGAN